MSEPFVFTKGCTLKRIRLQFFLCINIIKLEEKIL